MKNRLSWVCLLILGLGLGALAAGHDECFCSVEFEHEGVSITLSTSSLRAGFSLYVQKGAPKPMKIDDCREVVKIFDRMLDGVSAEWPKMDGYETFRFSVDKSAQRPYMIGRWKYKVWLTRDQMEELYAVAKEHLK